MADLKRKTQSTHSAAPASKKPRQDGSKFSKSAQRTGPAVKSFSARQGIAADAIKGAKTSAEAHAIQRKLAKERKLAKPNADSTQRAKKLWERLRRKSHVPVDERKELVAELFTIVTGHVKEFVFKHDSTRVIQCALKYATAAQSKEIARELRGAYRELAESRYAKFLVGKILVVGDAEVREWIVGEMQGWVRKGIAHPEAGWVLDDMYRGVCTKSQKAVLLREWYGPEYAIAALKSTSEADLTADLPALLERNPEKRKPTLDYLLQMITNMINKHMTAFTMLHDAMLQYSLAVGTPAQSAQASAFADLLRPDDDDEDTGAHASDLLQNLAFTASGSRLLSRVLATSPARDRKKLLAPFKSHVDALARDVNGINVLLTCFETVDDTKLLTKLFILPLISKQITEQSNRLDAIFDLATHETGRTALLYNMSASKPRWMIPADSTTDTILGEAKSLRGEASKKDPETRRSELADALLSDEALIQVICDRPTELLASRTGVQYITEIMLNAPPSTSKTAAMQSIASLCAGDPADDSHISRNSAAGRMLKTLVSGKKFDAAKGELVAVSPRIGFTEVLFPVIEGHVLAWASGESSFVVENMVKDEAFDARLKLVRVLEKGRKAIEGARDGGNKGAALILEAL